MPSSPPTFPSNMLRTLFCCIGEAARAVSALVQVATKARLQVRKNAISSTQLVAVIMGPLSNRLKPVQKVRYVCCIVFSSHFPQMNFRRIMGPFLRGRVVMDCNARAAAKGSERTYFSFSKHSVDFGRKAIMGSR